MKTIELNIAIEQSSNNIDLNLLLRNLRNEKYIRKNRLNVKVLEEKLNNEQGLVLKNGKDIVACAFSWSVPNNKYVEIGTIWIDAEYRKYHKIVANCLWRNIYLITNKKKICGKADTLSPIRYAIANKNCPVGKIANYYDDRERIASMCENFMGWYQNDLRNELKYHRIVTNYDDKECLKYFAYQP